MPDNCKKYQLPPNCGSFPIYSVSKYTTVDKKGKFLLVLEIEKMASGLNIVSNF